MYFFFKFQYPPTVNPISCRMLLNLKLTTIFNQIIKFTLLHFHIFVAKVYLYRMRIKILKSPLILPHESIQTTPLPTL